MTLHRSLAALAVGGTMLAALAGTAQAHPGFAGGGAAVRGAGGSNLVSVAHEHEHNGGWDHRRGGRIFEFNDYAFGEPDPFLYAYNGGGCRYLRMRWHQTGQRYWLRRYEECREG